MKQHILVANRGEIAIRIARAARELGYGVITVAPEDDAQSRHVNFGDRHLALSGRGVGAYLDMDGLIAAARMAGASAIHPGYGFLSESAAFSRACLEAGVTFIGPSPEALAVLGDKSRARHVARSVGAPVPAGIEGPITLEDAERFLSSLGREGALMLKAIHGGGGRGTRPVREPGALKRAFDLCQAEARAAFGDGALYAEELIESARHVEVQILRDMQGETGHAFERECSLQRRRQKLVEIAPSPSIDAGLRQRLITTSVQLAEAVDLAGLATFEFLVRPPGADGDPFVFIEANPRLQVEHTVSEEITGLDLVQTQIQLAFGETLAALGVSEKTDQAPRGFAIQLRINAENIDQEGDLRPSAGALDVFEPPTGPGVRVDTCGHVGFRPNPAYDSLLAKLVVHMETPRFANVIERARRALDEFRIGGCETNRAFLAALLAREEIAEGAFDTEYIDRSMKAIAAEAMTLSARYNAGAHEQEVAGSAAADMGAAGKPEVPEGWIAVAAPLSGVVVSLSANAGDKARKGDELMLIEAMKMQHEVRAPQEGALGEVFVDVGQSVQEGDILALLEPADFGLTDSAPREEVDPDHIRPDLAELFARKEMLRDANRPQAVAKMRARDRRMARENVEDLCDPGSFHEVGGLIFAAQRARRSVEDLRANTPADGMIAGVGSVNGNLFTEDKARCAVVSYDYTVFAGTQGALNHKKKDRIFDVALNARLPLVIFGGGGGGRPGETDIRLGLDISTFERFAKLKGGAPIISIVSGPCFAGNAALAGCADVMIAAPDANIGMGGPAMIEGGGLGAVSTKDIGPVKMQAENGVVDIVADNEADAVRIARKYLSYFQGPIADYAAVDQRLLRHIVPEDRMRVYSVREVLKTVADKDSVLELKASFGKSMVTALVRIGGVPVGVIANDPMSMSGAIDADSAEKAADFLSLCETHRIAVLSLCDTPGFMVGPEAEKVGQVKQSCRLFVQGANLSVPFFVVVLRKAYGLGAQAMAGGSFHAPLFAVSWPTGEFGAMGFEGAVRLGFRKELEAIADEGARDAFFQEKLQELYDQNKALTVAEYMEIDDVIDPAETRDWIIRGLQAAR